MLFGEDKNLLRDFFKVFIEATEKTLSDLEIVLSAADSTQGKALCHGLKGSCGNSGAIEMADLAQQMESCVMNNNWEDARKLHSALMLAFQRLRECSSF